MSESGDQLDAKVREWLEHEGYPLEFRVAQKLRNARFAVRQGSYIRDSEQNAPREIDVLAFLDGRVKKRLLRVYHVIECKWSKDKPWVVFTSDQRMAPAACITQTIASEFGSAVLWKEAGLLYLQELEVFATPKRSGFNGRQALTKEGADRFYSAMKSVVSLTKSLVDSYDDSNRKRRTLPEAVAVGFPVIVVQGELYEAFLDTKSGDIALQRTPQVRCHWKGSSEWTLHATVDVVTFDHLDVFLKTRSAQVETLLRIMETSVREVVQCVEKNSIELLNVTQGSRGVVGLHPLFSEFLNEKPGLSSLLKNMKSADRDGARGPIQDMSG